MEEIITKNLNLATIVEILTKDSNMVTKEEIIITGIPLGVIKKSLRRKCQQCNNRTMEQRKKP